MSSQKCSYVLMSAQEHSWVWCYGTMSAHERSWVPIASWRHVQDYSLALMSAHCSMAPSSCVFMAAQECSLVIRGTHGCFCLLMSAHKCSWALMSAHDCSRALLSSHEHSWAWHHGAMSTHLSSRTFMSMAPWGHRRSWALISTHEHSWCHCTILLRAFESSWALMRAHERPWELMSAKLLHLSKNKKC